MSLSAISRTASSPAAGTVAADSVEHYLAEFAAVEEQLPGGNVPRVRALRTQALERFAAQGFPGPRDENWKYTRVAPIEKRAFKATFKPCRGLLPEDIERHLIADLRCHRLVFVNGRCTPQLCDPGELPPGVRVGSLAQALNAEPAALEPHLGRYAETNPHAFSALNTAFMGDGAWIFVPRGVRLEQPVHVVFLSTAQEQEFFAHPRNVVVLEEGAEATVIESYASLGPATYFNNALTEVALGANAALEHYKLQEESKKGFHVATLDVHQGRDSRFASYSVSLGGALVRNDINAILDAEGAECRLHGLYLAGGRQHVDYHTLIDHRKPRGTSRELYKGILDGRAHGVFNGRVYVHPYASKTDAEQSNSNLLLSRDAEADTKPQLEIYADDVKCSHGATVGQLDENMIFYLRSRGIDLDAARGLLTYGFARDILDQMRLGAVRDRLTGVLVAHLPDAQLLRDLVQ